MYRLLPFFPILIFFGIYIFAVDFLTYKNPIVKEKIKQENKFFFSKEKEIISVSLEIINLKKKNTDPEKVETIKLKKKKVKIYLLINKFSCNLVHFLKKRPLRI